eukprot:TRINITY_DN782082_c0_g1_i1.p1 TRINITY_DN782082_c0_g1~~TRINITY_DN782082_c0_g1_i1.p1  ORF type:complete len:254 (+),score=25.19 TRINITY_DN782082_c0_g1_i1:36-797(+)
MNIERSFYEKVSDSYISQGCVIILSLIGFYYLKIHFLWAEVICIALVIVLNGNQTVKYKVNEALKAKSKHRRLISLEIWLIGFFLAASYHYSQITDFELYPLDEKIVVWIPALMILVAVLNRRNRFVQLFSVGFGFFGYWIALAVRLVLLPTLFEKTLYYLFFGIGVFVIFIFMVKAEQNLVPTFRVDKSEYIRVLGDIMEADATNVSRRDVWGRPRDSFSKLMDQMQFREAEQVVRAQRRQQAQREARRHEI